MILCTSEFAQQEKIQPLARILAFEDAATSPIDFPIAPALGISKVNLDFVNLHASYKTLDIQIFLAVTKGWS